MCGLILGRQDYGSALKFIQNQFLAIANAKVVSVNVTCATELSNVISKLLATTHQNVLLF